MTQDGACEHVEIVEHQDGMWECVDCGAEGSYERADDPLPRGTVAFSCGWERGSKWRHACAGCSGT